MEQTRNEIYLAGGCFWGTEKYLQQLPGVLETEVGYANGNKPEVTYEEVCRGSGHAEVVRVRYASDQISLETLLSEYYLTIDPTSLGRQGMDIGPQYRTGIYYVEESQRAVILQSIQKLQESYDRPIAIEVKPLAHFCPAEEYHQKYLDKNPGGYCHIDFKKIEKEKKRIVPPEQYQKPDKAQLQERLTPLQFAVTQENATEPPFQNPYWDVEEPGLYVDITTGEPLFSSADKFQSGCGWPSFAKAIDPNTVVEYDDLSHNMIRTEVRSRVGNAHLGHVFLDGPKELGGMRYCINSAAVRFIPKSQMEAAGYGAYLPYITE